MEFRQALRFRQSVKNYEQDHEIPLQTLKDIFEDVVLSPSSFNLQHWRFVVVADPDIRQKIQEASWNQPQVTESSVCVVILGKINAHEDAATIYSDVPASVREKVIPMIHGFYEKHDRLKRDEAIRSSSLAAMTLMLSAADKGYDTCPMIGFDPVKVSELIGSDQEHIPVMMVVIGKRKGEVRPRASRIPVRKCVSLNRLGGDSLD